jgi:hypothetical protein
LPVIQAEVKFSAIALEISAHAMVEGLIGRNKGLSGPVEDVAVERTIYSLQDRLIEPFERLWQQFRRNRVSVRAWRWGISSILEGRDL